MKRHDGAVSEETMLEVGSAIAARPTTRGAGVDQKRVVRPGKRLRNWHRTPTHGIDQIPLKQYARNLAASEGTSNVLVECRTVARRWLASKGARP